jgi:hypothetical protein
MGVLAMSRAIGDHGLRPYVIPVPEVGAAPLTLPAVQLGTLLPACTVAWQGWGQHVYPLAGSHCITLPSFLAGARPTAALCPTHTCWFHAPSTAVLMSNAASMPSSCY